MSLYTSPMAYYGFTYTNLAANPGTTPGTSVTPGASNSEGSWNLVATSGNIASDCYWIYLQVIGGATSAAAKNHLLDIGVDPAGGTSYSAIISNLQIGSSPAITAAGHKSFLFPFFIKAGSSVAVRIQGSNATAGTVNVIVKFWGQPDTPEAVPVGTFSETLGTVTNSNGQSFTPGNAANGSWTSLGTTTNPLWWWQVGYGIDNTTVTAEYTYIDIAYGDGSNKHIISSQMHVGTTNETVGLGINTQLAPMSYCAVPAGSTIYIRGRCLNAPDSNYHATVIGIGG